MDPLEKNLLDLKHSLSVTKGATFLGFGILGAFSIYSFARELIFDKNVLLGIAIIWLGIFGSLGVIEFNKCHQIESKIQKVLYKRIK